MTPIEQLGFRAETSAFPQTVELSWSLPDPAGTTDAAQVLIVRRERRFPGKGRRGFVPVAASPQDLNDGLTVYNTSSFPFDFEEAREELEDDVRINTARQYVLQGDPRDRVLTRVVRRELNAADNTPRGTRVRFLDRQDIVAGTIYYYTCFLTSGSATLYSRASQSSAQACDGGHHPIFLTLPQVHRQYDTVYADPATAALADQTKGQLERLLSVLEAHADLYHSNIAGLQDLHAIRRADSRVLPRLAQQVGWRLTDYLDEEGQRTELGFVADVYRTVGTTQNVAAMAKRLTGWGVEFREFAGSVIRSFDTARVETLESGATVYQDGSLQEVETPAPHLVGRRYPPGSVDTKNADAMAKLRARSVDDPNVYTYDTRTPDAVGSTGNYSGLSNLSTVGFYVSGTAVDQARLSQDGPRFLSALAGFLPIQIRPVLLLNSPPPAAGPH